MGPYLGPPSAYFTSSFFPPPHHSLLFLLLHSHSSHSVFESYSLTWTLQHPVTADQLLPLIAYSAFSPSRLPPTETPATSSTKLSSFGLAISLNRKINASMSPLCRPTITDLASLLRKIPASLLYYRNPITVPVTDPYCSESPLPSRRRLRG